MESENSDLVGIESTQNSGIFSTFIAGIIYTNKTYLRNKCVWLLKWLWLQKWLLKLAFKIAHMNKTYLRNKCV